MNIEDTIEELYSCLPGDRNKFNMIMEDMKKRFLRNAKNKNQSSQYKTSFKIKRPPYFPNNSPNPNFQNKLDIANNLSNNNHPFPFQNIINNKDTISSIKYEQNVNYRPIKIQDNNMHYNTQRNFYPEQKRKNIFTENNNKKNASNGFHGTLPDALYINPKPLRTNSQQKLLSDTHANCNFYYPEKNSNLYEGEIDRDGNGWHNQANNIMFNTNENFFIENK